MDKARKFKDLELSTLCVDFTTLDKPLKTPYKKRLGVLFGGTLGNFAPEAAARLLQRWRGVLGPQARLLVGYSKPWTHNKVRAAYNDALGVTASFNLGLLENVNAALGDEVFDMTAWLHTAVYNLRQQRVEMYVEAGRSTVVRLQTNALRFGTGERILTEVSYRWRTQDVTGILLNGGWSPVKTFTSDDDNYGLVLAEAL